MSKFKGPISGRYEATKIWIGIKFKDNLSIAVDEGANLRANRAIIDNKDNTRKIFLEIVGRLNLFKLKIKNSEGIKHKIILINEPSDE